MFIASAFLLASFVLSCFYFLLRLCFFLGAIGRLWLSRLLFRLKPNSAPLDPTAALLESPLKCPLHPCGDAEVCPPPEAIHLAGEVLCDFG